MFQSPELKNHFESSATIQTQSLVTAEWNMNMPDNIYKIGNYRYRPQEQDSQFLTLLNTFDNNDIGNFYTNATDADIVIDGDKWTIRTQDGSRSAQFEHTILITEGDAEILTKI